MHSNVYRKSVSIKQQLQNDVLRRDLSLIYNAEHPDVELRKKLKSNSDFTKFMDSCLEAVGALKNKQFDSDAVIERKSRKQILTELPP